MAHHTAAQGNVKDTVISILALGNAWYPSESPFDSYEGINYSAAKFAISFPATVKPVLQCSTEKHPLTRQVILDAVKAFVGRTVNTGNRPSLAIIYYCGHGIADTTGSSYLVPGDVNVRLSDTTFEFLSKKLLNMDELIHIIIDSQTSQNNHTQYVILADCCSNRVPSKWYKGISYHFRNRNEGSITYDSTFLKNMGNVNSALKGTAELTFDDLNKPKTSPASSAKPTINEIPFIPEMIRVNTFLRYANVIFYSSPLGKETGLVDDPVPGKEDYQIGPICRRTVLYFNKLHRTARLAYFPFLTSSYDKEVTSPAIVNRGRN